MKILSYKKVLSRLAGISLLLCCITSRSLAQNTPLAKQCGTMQVLEQTFEKNPSLKTRFTNQTLQFKRSVEKQLAELPFSDLPGGTVYIPIVFHIVLTTPDIISDAQVQAQLKVLNNDFGG